MKIPSSTAANKQLWPKVIAWQKNQPNIVPKQLAKEDEPALRGKKHGFCVHVWSVTAPWFLVSHMSHMSYVYSNRVLVTSHHLKACLIYQ
jgi:hypothetical protein